MYVHMYMFILFIQVCSAGSRLLVQENIADRLIGMIKERMTHLRLGDSLDKSIDMGAIVDASQRKTIDSYVQKAKEEGAEVHVCVCVSVSMYARVCMYATMCVHVSVSTCMCVYMYMYVCLGIRKNLDQLRFEPRTF